MLNKLLNWFKTPPKIYVACKMTGLSISKMKKRAKETASLLELFGFDVYHPVLKEDIPDNVEVLADRTDEEMTLIWNNDKKAVREATVLLDTAAEVYSTGAKREVGKGRYRDWTPLVTLWEVTNKPPFIARAEDDKCVTSVMEAAVIIDKFWGTRWKRILWRIPLYLKNWHDLSLYKLYRFFK